MQNYGLLSAQKYVENVYYHTLAKSLRSFGYAIINNARGDFEIAEVPIVVRELFSKRRREIDAKTRELLVLHPDKGAEMSLRSGSTLRTRSVVGRIQPLARRVCASIGSRNLKEARTSAQATIAMM